MLTEKDYCDYDTCVALKELGYNRGAYAYYFPNHKEDLIFNTHQMRGCSINEMLKGYNTYPKDVMGHELIDAPTMWEAQKWLREEKEVYVTVIPEYNDYRPVKGVKYRLEVAHWKDDEFGYETIEWLDEECPHTIITFDSYEEALSEGIKEAVKILKGERYEL